MGFVEFYKQSEQKFVDKLQKLDEQTQAAIKDFEDDLQTMVKPMPRQVLLDYFYGDELDGKQKAAMMVAWMETHKDEECSFDVMLALMALASYAANVASEDESNDNESE